MCYEPRMRLPRLLIILAAVAAISCRSEDDDGNNNPGTPDASLSTGMTIKQLLQGGAALESTVTLDNVVVVAHVSDSGDGQVFVQDPGGGAQAGIAVFCDFDSSTQMCLMSRDQVDELAVGDVISVTGRYTKAFNRINQITAPMWTKKGTTMAPVATTVTAAMVAKDAESSAGQWSNVYVKVNGPATISNMAPTQFKSSQCTPPRTDAGTPDAGAPVDYYRGFEVEAGGATLAIGFKLYDTLDYCLLDCGHCAAEDMLTDEDSFASVSGIVYFERGNSVNFLEIRPTKNSDLPKQ